MQFNLWRAQILELIVTEMRSLVTSEWLPAAQTDVKSLLTDLGVSATPAAEILNFLKTKYPFRAWLVLIEAPYSQSIACIAETLRLLPPQSSQHGVVHVLQSDLLVESSDLNSEVLQLIPLSRTVSPFACRQQSSEIVAEMRQDCALLQQSNMAAGAFPMGQGHVVFCSDQDRLKTIIVTRSFWKFCEQDYTAFIFE